MARWSALALTIAAAVIGGFACGSLIGVEPIHVDETTGAGAPDVSPDAAPPRLCPLGCLPPAPAGWTGPTAVFDGPLDQRPSACPTLYTVPEADGYYGIRSEPAACTCGASLVTGATCSVEMRSYFSYNCTSGAESETFSVPGSACVGRSTASANSVGFENPVIAYRGTCTYADGVTRTPPAADHAVRGCGLPQSGACETRADCVAAPVPQAPYTRVCLHAPGDLSCPSFDYAARFVASERIDDDRGCDFAGCSGMPGGGTCSTGVRVETAASCAAGGVPTTSAAGTCYTEATAVFNIRGVVPVGVTCPPGSAAAVGGAKLAGAVTTFCCNR